MSSGNVTNDVDLPVDDALLEAFRLIFGAGVVSSLVAVAALTRDGRSSRRERLWS